MRQRKHYTSEQKAKILRELLDNQTPISRLCEEWRNMSRSGDMERNEVERNIPATACENFAA